MKILFISEDLLNIKSANYQSDIYQEIQNKNQVQYINTQNINSSHLTKNYTDKFDIIIIGHSFLSDINNGININYNLDFSCVKKPIVFFLNKEYVNLSNKLKWIKKVNPKVVVTHSKLFYSKYKSLFDNTQLMYMPFAANEKFFQYSNSYTKNIDFSFSGILQNQNKNNLQSDMRIKILKNIFYTLGDIPILKKNNFQHMNIFWNTLPRYYSQRLLVKYIKKYKFLNIDEYASIQKSTKIYFNSLSPYGIVSPRYYENMLSKCLIFSEETSYLSDLKKDVNIITFKSVSEFNEKLNYYLNNSSIRDDIVYKCHHFGMSNHTWSIRIKKFMNNLKEIV